MLMPTGGEYQAYGLGSVDNTCNACKEIADKCECFVSPGGRDDHAETDPERPAETPSDQA